MNNQADAARSHDWPERRIYLIVGGCGLFSIIVGHLVNLQFFVDEQSFEVWALIAIVVFFWLSVIVFRSIMLLAIIIIFGVGYAMECVQSCFTHTRFRHSQTGWTMEFDRWDQIADGFYFTGMILCTVAVMALARPRSLQRMWRSRLLI